MTGRILGGGVQAEFQSLKIFFDIFRALTSLFVIEEMILIHRHAMDRTYCAIVDHVKKKPGHSPPPGHSGQPGQSGRAF